MKRIFVTLLTAVGITGPFVAHLSAESNAAQADIPFAFVVSGRTLPAGTYTVAEVKAGMPTFAVRDDRGHAIFVHLPINEDGKPQRPSLTFACYGNECVLAKVTPPNSEVAYALTQPGIDKQLSRRLGLASMISIKLGGPK